MPQTKTFTSDTDQRLSRRFGNRRSFAYTLLHSREGESSIKYNILLLNIFTTDPFYERLILFHRENFSRARKYWKILQIIYLTIIYQLLDDEESK